MYTPSLPNEMLHSMNRYSTNRKDTYSLYIYSLSVSITDGAISIKCGIYVHFLEHVFRKYQ